MSQPLELKSPQKLLGEGKEGGTGNKPDETLALSHQNTSQQISRGALV